MTEQLVILTEYVDAAAVEMLRAETGLKVLVAADLDAAGLRQALSRAAAVGVRIQRIDAAMIAAAPNLRIIAKHGVGTDNIDLEAATRRGVAVLNTPDANKIAVAEHAFALLLALAKRLPAADAAVRSGDWGVRDRHEVIELAGRTLAIVGFGRSGQELAVRARAFGMHVVTWGRTVDARRAAGLGVDVVPSLAEALGRADAVSLHVPRSPGPPLIGAAEIARMRRGALLVNCARGGVVDEAELADALRSGHIGGAGIDVFESEPPAIGHPLLALPNVIATPHAAGNTRAALRRMALGMAENIVSGLAGQIAPERLVNPAYRASLAREVP